MTETVNYGLKKPAAGENGWAADVNGNFDTIDSKMNDNESGLANHVAAGTNKHAASAIQAADGNSVEDKLAALAAGKSDTSHNHDGDYASQDDMDAVENTLDLLAPDLSAQTLNVSVQNRNGGLRISFGFSTNIYWTNAQITIENADEEQLVTLITGASIAWIDGSDLTGVEADDVLTVTVVVNSGSSSKTRVVSHTFQETNNAIEDRLDTLESTMTIANLIDSFSQDASALQALANVLHSSNTLAQKVAELMAAE